MGAFSEIRDEHHARMTLTENDRMNYAEQRRQMSYGDQMRYDHEMQFNRYSFSPTERVLHDELG